MLRYISKRLIFNFLSLWIILTLTFLVMKSIPGDPFNDENSNMLSQEALHFLKSRYGLNQPLYQQYIQHIKALLKLDFGHSLVYKDRSVLSIISTAFPSSAILGLQSLCLSIFGGIFLGTYAALRKGKQGRYVLLTSILQISTPAFIVAAMLQYLFAVKMPILPIACWGNFTHTILPTLSLAVTPTAFITQLTYSSVSSALNKDYVFLAYSKGLSTIKVVVKHVLPYAIFPTISYAAFLVTTVMTGIFAIENIFCIPGLGKWFVYSIKQRDYPLVLGLSVFYGAIFMLASLLSDLIHAMIDPQIRYSYRKEPKTHAQERNNPKS